MIFGPAVQEEMSVKAKVYGETTDNGQSPITIAHLQPSVQVS